LDRQRAHGEYVVHGQAVLQAVHAARVLGDVAADGAGDLTRWIGRVAETIRRDRFRDGEIAHAGLDRRGARALVDVEDAIEPGERKRAARAVRQRSTGERRAGTTRYNRRLHRATATEYVLHLLFRFG